MDGWEIARLVANLIARIPLENLAPRSSSPPTRTEPKPEKPKAEKAEKVTETKMVKPPPEEKATKEEELDYTALNMQGQMRALATHLKDGGLVMGKSCDCLGGHNAEMRELASEGVRIGGREHPKHGSYRNIVTWATEKHPDIVRLDNMPYRSDEDKARRVEEGMRLADDLRPLYKEFFGGGLEPPAFKLPPELEQKFGVD